MTAKEIKKMIIGSKEVYAEGTMYPPHDNYKEGDEVVEEESEWNEALNYVLSKIPPPHNRTEDYQE
jgi:hypothetical protein